jgi:glycosyltransferase involved in cell wall biosynthesis
VGVAAAGNPLRCGAVAHRIAHILAWPIVAGTEISTIRIARGLGGAGFQHVAFCTTEAPAVEAFFRTAGFPTVAYRSVEPSYRRPGPFLKASIQLARELRRQKVALVHCSDLMAGLRAAPAAKLAGLPVLCHIRNPDPLVSLRDRPLLRAIDHFVFVSRHAWDSFGYPVSVRRGSIIYDGIESIPIDRDEARERLLTQFSLPAGSRLVGMVGRLAPQKDHVTLIRAAARVIAVDPTVRFLVVGDHNGTEAFRRQYLMLAGLVEDLRLTEHVIFAGFRDDVAQVLSGLDVSVLATNFEGFGLVIVEAMAQGTPVIATEVGGVTEIIGDQETGLLHRPADDADLAAKILTLLSDKALAERLAAAGRRLVEDRFTIQGFTSNMAGLYLRTLGVMHGT